MQKPKSLRLAIENALPEIAANPEKLAMFIENGRISANKGTLSHTENYTLTLLITDFVSNLDVLKTSMINWLQIHQPDILGAGAVAENAFTFQADILSHDTADVLIQLRLSERVNAMIDENRQIHITHPKEPQLTPDLTGVLGAAWGKNENWNAS